MKIFFRIISFVIIFSFCFSPGFLPVALASEASPVEVSAREASISMDFQNARLKDILKILSIQSGLNFIASEAVQDRLVTLYLDNVPLSGAMDKLFKANNLSYELDRDASIFTVKDWGKMQTETITRIFFLKYATVSSSPLQSEKTSSGEESESGGSATEAGGVDSGSSGITQVVTGLLSAAGSVVEDPRTNSLIVTDTPNKIEMIARTIKALDIPTSQVMLEVEMLDVSKNALERIGLKFGDIADYPSIFALTSAGAVRNSKFPFSPWASGDFPNARTGSAGDITAGSLTVGNFQVLLDLIKSQTDTKYLARPRLLTLNNETAELKINTQETVGTVTKTYGDAGSSGTSVSAERVETGVSLRVTPQIVEETGEITMYINPKVIEASVSALNSSYKDPEQRETKTKIKVRDGETVIIAGLIRRRTTDVVTKLPFLGDLPFVGNLFKHRNHSQGEERELLVFITPRIIKDEVKLAQTNKVTLPEREQSVTSGMARDLAINAILNNFEKAQPLKR